MTAPREQSDLCAMLFVVLSDNILKVETFFIIFLNLFNQVIPLAWFKDAMEGAHDCFV